MSKIGHPISTYIPTAGLITETRHSKDTGYEELRQSFDTDDDGRADTLLVQERKDGETLYTSLTHGENGSIEGTRVVGHGIRRESMTARANGRISSHEEALTDGRVGYRYHKDEDGDGFVDYSTLRTGTMHPQLGRVILDSVSLQDEDFDGTFDKQVVSARYLMLNGPELYSDEGLSQGGLLLNKNEESEVSLPVDTLPQKGQEEELVMSSLLRFLTGQNG